MLTTLRIVNISKMISFFLMQLLTFYFSIVYKSRNKIFVWLTLASHIKRVNRCDMTRLTLSDHDTIPRMQNHDHKWN